MNKMLSIIIVAMGITSGCATRDNTGVKDERAGTTLSSREVILTVYGLSCPLCSNNLDGQLEKLAGVEDTRIDLKTGAVTIRLTEGHSVSYEHLANAVKNAGFTLKEVNPKGSGQ
jgi:copper chaperone CopZ